mmetsp:Transcript_63063/g.184410  ORF Transcript_63063/g.184410 Transcript_63063/m.184410 type:complete len:83 (-) Transcript_63063:185-433(-)
MPCHAKAKAHDPCHDMPRQPWHCCACTCTNVSLAAESRCTDLTGRERSMYTHAIYLIKASASCKDPASDPWRRKGHAQALLH